MPGHIIDGERWIRERLRFLRERLDGEVLEPGERKAIEAEVTALNQERGLTVAGRRSLLGWLRRTRK
jgi:hypothetical protein